MDKSGEKSNDKLSKESRKRIKDELWDQAKLIFNRFENATNKYNQHVFIVNAGSAAAVLAFLGTKTGPSFLIWPLMLFAAGVIVCGIDLLASFYITKAMSDDAMNRYNESKRVNFSLEEILPKEKKVFGTI